MKNRTVGMLIVGIALVIAAIIYMFNQAMTTIVATECTHGLSCPMWGTIDFQTNVAIGLMTIVIGIGLYLVFFSKDEMVIKRITERVDMKRPTKETYGKVLKTLQGDERLVLEKIIEADGSIFQSDLVDKSGLGKVKVSRVLDKLEGQGLVERKQRGMTNVILLKRR
jgi:uncharacterized membrane protein